MVTAPYEVSVWGTLLMVLYSGRNREQTKHNSETCIQAKHTVRTRLPPGQNSIREGDYAFPHA